MSDTDRAGAYVVTPGVMVSPEEAKQTKTRQDVTSYVRDWIIEELRRQGVGYEWTTIPWDKVPADALPWLIGEVKSLRDRYATAEIAREKLARKAAKRKRRKAKRRARTEAAMRELRTCRREE